MTSQAGPKWLHVDINSYFATLLEQENPALRGKPFGVIKSTNRTCLIAVSKAAKKYGIKTGCGLKEAEQLCPGIITVPAAFDMYLDGTRRLRRVFESLSPSVEIFSLDEAFMNLEGCRELYKDEVSFGGDLQQHIKAELGEWVTCNVGIARTKLLAKLASEMSAKGSVNLVQSEAEATWLAKAEFDEVCGVGMRLSKKLKQLGVTHPYQLNFVSDEDLALLVGPFWADQLRLIGVGDDPDFLRMSNKERPHMLSVGRSITGFQLCDDEQTIKQTLYNLCDEVIYKVRKMKLAGRYMSIGLRGGESWGEVKRWRRHVTLQHYVCHTQEFFDIIYNQLYGQWRRPFPVIKLSVGMSLLKPWTQMPQPLWPQWHQREKVAKAVDSITERYGLFTVRSGTLVKANLIRPEVTGFLGDKAYQLDMR